MPIPGRLIAYLKPLPAGPLGWLPPHELRTGTSMRSPSLRCHPPLMRRD